MIEKRLHALNCIEEMKKKVIFRGPLPRSFPVNLFPVLKAKGNLDCRAKFLFLALSRQKEGDICVSLGGVVIRG